LTCQYGFPYLPLSSYEIDAEVIRSVPENVCRQFCLVPIDKIGKSLTVAMSNPLNVQALEDVELITGCSVQVFVSTATDVKQSIDKYYIAE
ncbi:MAG: type II secretion system protein GspE, partial [Candidatus Omnitrophica bacterium]|nr:type II secretion system protein GspE [Candidatus Omnitrophota bacterium]